MSRVRLFLASSIVLVLGAPSIQAQGGAREREPEGVRPNFAELRRMLPRGEEGSVVLGDLDGDGDLDAALGGRLHFNDGAGVFTEAAEKLSAVVAINAADLGDVDGDGDLDLLLGNTGANQLFRNDGVFTDVSVQLPFFTDATRDVALEDLNGDGDLDAVLANWISSGGTNRIYTNDGGGLFADATDRLPINPLGGFALDLGDVDDDGDLDILIGAQTRFRHEVFPEQNLLHLNNGNGRFFDATSNLPVVADKTFDVALADVDGDDDLDAFIANGANVFVGEASSLWLNDGDGSFAVSPTLPFDDDYTGTVALGDMDGDGDSDAMLGNDGQNRYYRNAGAAVFEDATANLPVGTEDTRTIVLGDVDDDGDLDVLNANLSTQSPQNRLYLNDGDAGFLDVTLGPGIPGTEEQTNDLAAGDVDGDGRPDVLVATAGQDRLLLNDGAGLLGDATANLPANASASYAVALADVDGNGSLDALVGTAAQDQLLANDGTGAFSDASGQLPGLVHDTRAIAFADIDGDGDPDAQVGNHLYTNVAGTFSDASNQLPAGFPTGGPSADDFAFGDLEHDGDLDLVMGGGILGLFENDGNGVFTDESSQLPDKGEGRVRAVALGDLDQDGHLDVLDAEGGSVVFGHVTMRFGEERVFVNDGSGTFGEGAALPEGPEVVLDLALADVDGDGDLDAVMTGNGLTVLGEPNLLYANDGDGVFTDVTEGNLELVSDATRAVVLDDFDGDHDVDMVVGNEGEDRIHWNLTRQLARKGLPRVGQPLDLDLYGEPGSKWMVASALDTGTTLFPPFGTFGLQAGTFQVMGVGTFGPSGSDSVRCDVPPDAGLIGVTVYWQTLFAYPVCFSQVEATALTDF